MTPSVTPTLCDAYKLPHTEHDKIMSPEATVRHFKERCKAANLNILKETRRVDTHRIGIPVYYSVCGHDAGRLTGTKKQMGKGVTPALAEASAVMELAERFSLYSFMERPGITITGTFDDIPHALPFEKIVQSVEPIPMHAGTLPKDLPENNPSSDGQEDDPALQKKIFDMLKLKWVKGFNHSTGNEVSIPMDWFFMINEFNGSSAGNCHEEAVCQGACEIMERHVSAIVAHQKASLPYIDPASVTNPTTAGLIAKFNRAGIKLYINDFSLETGIPTIGVLAYDPETFPETSEIVWTAGTAPSPDKALSRALTEVAQLAGDFNTGSNYVASGLPKFTDLKQAAFIIDPIEEGSCQKVALSTLPDISNDNIKVEIEAVIKAMKSLDLDLIVIDTTDPRLGIPTCYTIVPGAFFRERAENSTLAMFAARHLYENEPAPVAYGKLTQMADLIPGRYVIAFYQGLCQLKLENPEKALVHLETAMTLQPIPQDIATIASYTGICLKELGRYDEAIIVLESGVAHDDERPDLYNLLGFCHFMQKRHEASIACFEKVLKLTPGSGIDHASIGSNYRELGVYDKAIQYYELALALDPSLDFARENIEKLTGLITTE